MHRTVKIKAIPILAFAIPVVGMALALHTFQAPARNTVAVCKQHLCIDDQPWQLYGATVYNPGLHPPRSGIDNPEGTVALARQARLNTIRLVNFMPDTGDPKIVAFDERRWIKVDRFIAAAGHAGLKINLDLADYRNLLWNNCVDPYTSDWTRLIRFVGHRRNTASGLTYVNDPTIAMVSIAGEPLPTGSHDFQARTTGSTCHLAYTQADLTAFFDHTMTSWNDLGGAVLVNSGGLGYLDFRSGIDWQAIFALPSNAVCSIKTYGGMLTYAPVVARYCATIGKPLLDEEFGWRQDTGDSVRATKFTSTISAMRSLDVAGTAFWNLGYEAAPQSYEVGPETPLTFAAVQRNAPS